MIMILIKVCICIVSIGLLQFTVAYAALVLLQMIQNFAMELKQNCFRYVEQFSRQDTGTIVIKISDFQY